MRLGKYLPTLIKPELEELKEICNFTDEELLIIENLCNNRSHEQISMDLKYSSRTIGRRILGIKQKIKKAKGIVL